MEYIELRYRKFKALLPRETLHDVDMRRWDGIVDNVLNRIDKSEDVVDDEIP